MVEMVLAVKSVRMVSLELVDKMGALVAQAVVTVAGAHRISPRAAVLDLWAETEGAVTIAMVVRVKPRAAVVAVAITVVGSIAAIAGRMERTVLKALLAPWDLQLWNRMARWTDGTPGAARAEARAKMVPLAVAAVAVAVRFGIRTVEGVAVVRAVVQAVARKAVQVGMMRALPSVYSYRMLPM